jgi:tetratricopeptide (TPR) repeat protein
MAQSGEKPAISEGESLAIAPLCFVLMPFGKKKDAEGVEINFDEIYYQGIKPGIEDAQLEPLRADAERTGGVIHTAMFERLLLSEYALADLTTANANVFYELGVRHAARRNTTLLTYADGRLPFDLNYARTLPYKLGANNNFGPEEAQALRQAVAARLRDLIELRRTDDVTDSPLFQVLDGYQAPELSHLKTDTFRERVRYSEQAKTALAKARSDRDVQAIAEIEASLGQLDESHAGIIVDIMLSYRAFSNWQRMVEIIERMPEALKRTQMIQEQYGLALNRLQRRDEAIRVLEAVIEKYGKNSESCGILGRAYKDKWEEALKANERRARGFLRSAIEMYVQGFDADWRDYYPGVNALSLLHAEGGEESMAKLSELLPVVRYSLTQRFRLAKGSANKLNYWDHATMLELAVLANDRSQAELSLDESLAMAQEDWVLETTAKNLSMISTARAGRGAATPWVDELVVELEKQAKQLRAAKE